MNPSRPGSLIALRHFSFPRPIACSLVSGDLESFFTVRIREPIGTYMSISKGDPIVFGLMVSDSAVIRGGFILSRKEGSITISPDTTTPITIERRKSPRFPVSLLGRVNSVNGRECSIPARIKDISYDDIRIYTEYDLNIRDSICVSIREGAKEPDIMGTVVRNARMFGRNEYGVQIMDRSGGTVSSVKEFIDFIAVQEEHMIEEVLLRSLHHVDGQQS